MGLIYKRLRLEGGLSQREGTTLFDTGASNCFVNKDVASLLSNLGKAPFPLRFEMAQGTLETDEAIMAAVIDPSALRLKLVPARYEA